MRKKFEKAAADHAWPINTSLGESNGVAFYMEDYTSDMFDAFCAGYACRYDENQGMLT